MILTYDNYKLPGIKDGKGVVAAAAARGVEQVAARAAFIKYTKYFFLQN